jgi:tRNA(Arg) A34 adenosine deaminase TadA
VLSLGKNSYVKTHPLQAHYAKLKGVNDKIYLHAEIHAISRCRQLNQAYKMVITRFGARGEPRLAKPCEICEEALLHTPIRNVVYTI